MINNCLKEIYEALSSKLANNVKIIDVSDLTSLTDYIIIADANNVNQLDTLVDTVERTLANNGVFAKSTEGNSNCGWVLMDYRDALINLFTSEQREFYNIERIWQDGREIVFQ